MARGDSRSAEPVREINLLNHLPHFMQKYLEMQLIMNSETEQFKELSEKARECLNNQFIETCNEEGIARFEKLLGISSKPADTLEERIIRVISKWNDSIPYTYKSLTTALDVLCGKLNYSINQDFKNYKMSLKVSMSTTDLIQLDDMLKTMVPANISVSYSNNLPLDLDSRIKAGAVVSKAITRIIN